MSRPRTVASILVPALLLACADELPTATHEFVADAVPAPRVFAFNTQLRGIINPDIEPSPARGHFQVRLTANEDGTFSVSWQGRIFNAAAERFVRGTVGMVGGGVDPIVTLFRLGGDGIGCDVIDLAAEDQILPADVGRAFILNPEIHEARFESLERPDGAVVGSFGIIDPDHLVGFNPQPDPPKGGVVRCAV